MVANVTAYIIAQIHNFIWCKYWIFPVEKRKNNVWKQILFFCSAFGLAYSAQFLFLVTLVECGDVNEYLAQFLGLFIYGTVTSSLIRSLHSDKIVLKIMKNPAECKKLYGIFYQREKSFQSIKRFVKFPYSSILRSRRNGHQRRTFSERSRSTSTIIFSERSFPA